MISFNLICAEDHEFEGWFQNSADFDKQAKKNLIECPVCGDAHVEKSLMAPSLGTKGEVRNTPIEKAEQATNLQDRVRFVALRRTTTIQLAALWLQDTSNPAVSAFAGRAPHPAR